MTSVSFLVPQSQLTWLCKSEYKRAVSCSFLLLPQATSSGKDFVVHSNEYRLINIFASYSLLSKNSEKLGSD